MSPLMNALKYNSFPKTAKVINFRDKSEILSLFLLPFTGPFDVVIENTTDTNITVSVKKSERTPQNLSAFYLYYNLNNVTNGYYGFSDVNRSSFTYTISDQEPAQQHTVSFQAVYYISNILAKTNWSSSQTVWTLPTG